MKKPREASRRRFLRSAGGAVAAVGFFSPSALLGACGGRELSPAMRRAARAARAYFEGDPGGRAADLGDAYAASLDSDIEEDLEGLVGEIERIEGEPDSEPVLAALAEKVAADFRAAGDLVRLEGWTCGRTELRLCALVALAS